MKKLLLFLLGLFLYTFIQKATAQINVALTATATHAGGGQSTAGYGPEEINDGVITNIANPGPNWVTWVNTNGWYEFNWPTQVSFDSMVIYTADRGFTTGVLQYWNGTAFVNIMNITGASVIDTFYYKFPSLVTTNRFRMANLTGSNPNFTEVELYLGVENDMMPSRMISPVLSPLLCSGMYELEVLFRNNGANTVDSFLYSYVYDNITYGPFAYHTPVAIADSVALKIGHIAVPYNVIKPLKIITSLPNGVTDGDRGNDTLTINMVANIEGITISPFPDTFLCKNNSLLISAGYNPNCDYTWSTGQQTQAVTIDQPGTYWLFAYNIQGCEYRDTFEVNTAPIVKASNLLSIIQQSHFTYLYNIGGLENETLISWDFGDNTPLEYGIGPKPHTYTNPGTYYPIVTIANECDTLTRTQTVVIAKEETNIEDLTNQPFKIYPNPAINELFIDNRSNIIISEIAIYNTIGQRIKTDIVVNDNNINIANLNTGHYLLLIQTKSGIFKYPFIKK